MGGEELFASGNFDENAGKRPYIAFDSPVFTIEGDFW
jgi:hypothetical protein